MFRPLKELIHAYFARTWPIAARENQPDVINGGLIPILRMGASRLPVRVRTRTGHQCLRSTSPPGRSWAFVASISSNSDTKRGTIYDLNCRKLSTE
jgi:hypothetical protein